jgi:hypothetical protein
MVLLPGVDMGAVSWKDVLEVAFFSVAFRFSDIRFASMILNYLKRIIIL